MENFLKFAYVLPLLRSEPAKAIAKQLKMHIQDALQWVLESIS